MEIKIRLAELQGEMTQIMSTMGHLQERRSFVRKQMEALEKELQGQTELNLEQKTRLNAAGGCTNGDCG